MVVASSVTVYRGLAGDHNELAMSGSVIVGGELGRRAGVVPDVVGQPRPVLNTAWAEELDAARDDLAAMAAHVDALLTAGSKPLLAITRCAVGLATVPVVARHRPDACVVWFDAHADVHRPETTTSDFLGGMALSGPLGWWDSGFGGGLAVANALLAGTRDIDPAEDAVISERGLTLLPPGPDLPARLRDAVAGRPVFAHLDCDVLEPGIVPTDYAVPAGLTLDDLHACAEVLAASEVVGLEVAEFQDADPTPSAAALVDALTPLLR